jgi:hypothetical protein
MSLRYKNCSIPNDFGEDPPSEDVYNDLSDEFDEGHCIICGTLLPENNICQQCGKNNNNSKDKECYI